MGQGAGVSHASQPFQPSGSMPGSALPRSPSLSSFSSMGCEDPRVPVLITDERCRAWTPGLTSQHDSLWDHFSPDGIAWLALSPQIKCSACYCSVSYVCVCVWTHGFQVVKPLCSSCNIPTASLFLEEQHKHKQQLGGTQLWQINLLQLLSTCFSCFAATLLFVFVCFWNVSMAVITGNELSEGPGHLIGQIIKCLSHRGSRCTCSSSL